MEERRHFSLSQVQTYLACPLKYRFQYVDQIPRPWRVAALAFGSSVHAAVEYFHKQRLAGYVVDTGDVLRIFDADWYAQNLEPLVFSERESSDALAEKGRAMLQLYVEQQGKARAVQVEQPFELELADPETGECLEVFLRGIVDLVEEDGTLVDLKTAGRTPEPGGLERHLQLSTYALVHFLRRGEIPNLRLDILLKTQKPRFEQHSTTRSLADLRWTAYLIQRVALAIQTEHFFPNPSWRCTECEYFAHCQAWRGEETLIAITDVGGAGEAAAATEGTDRMLSGAMDRS